MDDRGDKFIINSSASSSSSRNARRHLLHPLNNPSHIITSCNSRKCSEPQRKSIVCSWTTTTTPMQFTTSSSKTPTTQRNSDEEDDSAPFVFESAMWNPNENEGSRLGCKDEDDKSFQEDDVTTASTAATAPDGNEIDRSFPSLEFGVNYWSSSAPSTGTTTLMGHHHRSRLKDLEITFKISSPLPPLLQYRDGTEDKENQTPLRSPSSSSPTPPPIKKICRRRFPPQTGRNEEELLISSTNSTSSDPTATSSSSSPSRFLLTFLSTCHLVQVTSRLVVALAVTSLFLILLQVLPGAYCATSSSKLTPGAAIIISQTHHHQWAYLNKSGGGNGGGGSSRLLWSSPPNLNNRFKSELSGGGQSQQNNDEKSYDDGTLLKVKVKPTTANNNARNKESPEGMSRGDGVDDNDDEVVKPVSAKNRLAISKRSPSSNRDYSIGDKGDPLVPAEPDDNENNGESGFRVDYKSARIDSKLNVNNYNNNNNNNNNYDYYNSGNNNNYDKEKDKVSINNRSNYNYYDTNFIVESTKSTGGVGSVIENSTNYSNNYSEKNNAASDNNNTQAVKTLPQQPLNRGDILYSDDFTETDGAETGLGRGGVTMKEGITQVSGAGVSGSATGRGNNGTTRAERDSILNVSSTGVRPTMAFTKSYYGRGQGSTNKDENGGGKDDEESYNGGGEEDIEVYTVREQRRSGGEGEEEEHVGEEDEDEPLLEGQSSSPRTGYSPAQADNNNNNNSPIHTKAQGLSSSSNNALRDDSGGREYGGFPLVSSTSHHHPPQHHSSSFSSTQFLSTTKTTITAHTKGGGGSSSSLPPSQVSGGGGEKIPTPMKVNRPSSADRFNEIEITFSSTTSFRFPNDNSSSTSSLNEIPLVVSSSKAPHQNNLVHSHHSYHQQRSLPPVAATSRFQEKDYEAFAFGGNVDWEVVDEDQDQVLLGEEDAGEEDEFLDRDEEEEEKKKKEQRKRDDKKSRLNSFKLGVQLGGAEKSPRKPSKGLPPNNQNYVELFSGMKTMGELKLRNREVGGTQPIPTTIMKLGKSYHSPDVDRMLGDDPSNNLQNRESNSLKRNPTMMVTTTTTQTMNGMPDSKSKPKLRSAGQIRRDLSRLVASSAGRNGAKEGGTAIVGPDEEPMPNKCDRLFISSGAANGTSGTFESPTMISEEGHLYQCIFMFVAKPMERVEVVFQQFHVRGTPPECVHEWVDIWTEVEGTDPTDLVTTPFSGRYCGRIPPRRRISLYGGIAIGFYSDKNSTDETIFRGTYAFINDSPYQIGTPVPRTLCSYTIYGSSKRNGDLISPTYPGVYPKNLSCSYKFLGIEGQRIRLEFRDFDVFYGGAHCPFDEVKVYDGMDPTSPLIGTYCGQQRNLVVFSSAHLMLVTFTTLERSTEAQNRGFKGVWEFSESFVKLDFIEKNMGTHIRGTECDQRILSKGQSSGVVYSPNYPFPYVPKIVCRYFIYGLQDPQHLERVRLSFEKFDVITNINSGEEETTNQSEDKKKCGDGFLKVYLKGQEVIQAYDKADYEFCGKEVPHDVVSDGPRLVLVFSSGEAVGSGFKARYQFETEYRVPGTAAPDGSCHFTYYSTSRMKGEFNSPRFPSNYPSMTNCTYIFFQQPNEQVRIVFDNFKMRSDKFNYTDRGAYGDLCEEDWVEIWNVISDAEDRLVGRYCGSTAPGPIESREKASALKVILHTDDEGVSSGFKARYIYFTAKTIFGECGQNITQAQSGVLTSPKWPGKYDGPSKGEGSATCNWYLSVRPGSRVMLHFQNFAIEGEPNGRGCPAAAVRIWVDPDGVPVELCGESLMVENSQYVSARNLMRVTFITADKAVGAPGFRAVWTEVQEVSRQSSGAPCHHSYFRCEKSLFCIPAELRCDGVDNCGTNEGETDTSDEDRCGLEFGDMNFLIAVIVGVAISLFLVVLLCAYGQRRKRRRNRRLQLRRPPIHVCDNAGARFAAMDSV